MKITSLIIIIISLFGVFANAQTDATIYDVTDTIVAKPRWVGCETIVDERLAQDCWDEH